MIDSVKTFLILRNPHLLLFTDAAEFLGDKAPESHEPEKVSQRLRRFTAVILPVVGKVFFLQIYCHKDYTCLGKLPLPNEHFMLPC